MSDLLLGIDVGTSSVKVGVLDGNGRLTAAGSAPCRPESPRLGWSQINPAKWWRGLRAALGGIADAGVEPGEVRAVGLSVLFPALVPMDGDGRPLAPAILYRDRRAAKEVDVLSRRLRRDAIERRTGCRLVPGTTSVTGIEWLRAHRPAVFRRVSRFGHANTYIAHRLTGEWGIDRTNASLTGLLDIASPDRFSAFLCRRLRVPMEKLPPVLLSSDIVGEVTARAARATGLRRGIPVVMGGGDAAVAAFGGGLREGNDIFYVAGTTDCTVAASNRPRGDLRFANMGGCLEARWLGIGTMTSSGAAAEWFAHRFVSDAASVAEVERLACARGVRPGAGGVLFLPYLQGERSPVWDPHARAAFTGLALSHGVRDLARAVLEGVGFGLRHIVEAMESSYGMGKARIRAVGGGTRNRQWLRIKASILGRPIEVLHTQECGVLGAAMLAGIGAGVYGSFDDALKATAACRRSRVVEPVPAWTEVYDGLFPGYVSLYPRLRQEG